jgi:hypothetical protein
MLVCRVFPSQIFAINMQIKTALFIAIAACGTTTTRAALPTGCIKNLRWLSVTNETASFPTNLLPVGHWSGGYCDTETSASPGSACAYTCRCPHTDPPYNDGMYPGGMYLTGGQVGSVCETKATAGGTAGDPSKVPCTSFEVLTFDKFEC